VIKRYYSLVEPSKLLHMVCRTCELSEPRIDVVEDKEYLQLAVLNYEKGRTFAAHKHIFKEVPTQAIAQESWVILEGKVKATFYDIDDQLLVTEELKQGDVSITLFGGHNYEILEEGTRVLEYKTGPYYGQKLDKVFING